MSAALPSTALPWSAATPPEAEAPAWFQWALAQVPESHRVMVDGHAQHYLGWSLQDRHKPLLLLVHGHRAHAHWWDFVAPFLATTHRVIALDLSGMGDSDALDVYPRDQGARDINGLIRALGLPPVIAIGHSNGGLRALAACGQAPELFERLIAIDSYVVFDGGDHPSDPPGLRGDRVYADLDEAVRRYRLLPAQPKNEPWALRHIAQHSLRPAEGGWRWKFDPTMPSGLSYEEPGDTLLAAVHRPVHYVYGEASAVVSAALAQRIVQQLPQGHGPIGIPGGHHHLMVDEPLALIATLRALLA
jgi:pimeloyl-ACP methyl ester carboxylesterase